MKNHLLFIIHKVGDYPTVKKNKLKNLGYTSFMRYILLSSLFGIIFFVGKAQPVITSFTPTSGAVGTSITINGSNFNTTAGNNVVYFGATKASVTAASATSLTVTVPSGATYQPITVINTGANLSGESKIPFTVTFNGGVGQTITSTSFNARVNFTTGINPSAIVAIADIDGDGKPDMVAIDRLTNTFSVLRNTTTGTTISFAAKVDFVTDSTPSSVAIADLDGDGKLDIVITSQFKNKVWIYRNTSTSGSITSASFATGIGFITDSLSLPTSVAIGDLDGDGKPDLAVINSYSNTVSILKNATTTGGFTSASFAPAVDFTTGLGPTSVVITDIDGDGKPDLAIANFNAKTISVLRNTTTTGTINSTSFAAKVDFTTATGPYSIAAGDLNNDNKTDLLVANQGSNTISVFSNTATSGSITSSSLAAKVDIPSNGESPYYVSVGNIDGDDKPDILVNNLITKTMSVIKNNFTSGSISSSSFAAGVNFATGNYPFAVSIADIDGDGVPDLAVPNYGDNNISIFRNLLSNTTVPVRLIAFTGKYQPTTGNNLLNWQTTLEINASYFYIQRSIDGTNFSIIAEEKAIGNSSLLDNYDYSDNNVSALGVNKIFYRLQEVDDNGATTYSNIISIDLSDKSNPLSVFPNPAINNIIVSHPGAANNAHLLVTTVDGKIIIAQNVVAGSSQTLLDVSAFSKGTYIIIYSDDSHKAVTRFVKL